MFILTKSLICLLTVSICCRCPAHRKQYRKLLQCIVVIQKNYRAFYWRRKFLLLRWAALTFQKRVRGQLARRAYSQQLEERRKREEEERCRRMEELERWAGQVNSTVMSPIFQFLLF